MSELRDRWEDPRRPGSTWSYLFDSERKQRADINTLQKASAGIARRLSRKQAEAGERIQALEQQVGELTLLCRALLEVLADRELLEADALVEAMRAIDAEDGVVDGRVTPEEERPVTEEQRESEQRELRAKAPTRRRRRR